MNELILSPTSNLTTKLILDAQGLVVAFLAGRKPLTQKAYKQDLEAFRLFVGAESVAQAAQLFLSSDQNQANAIAHSYQSWLKEKAFASATVNRRLSGLRSLLKLARRVGLCSYQVEVDDLDEEKLRDTRGPGANGAKKMLALLEKKTDPKSLRDYAILRLLYNVALRRGEVCSLDLKDIDLEGKAVWVMGKGRSQRQRITLPPSACEALSAWRKVRGATEGPMFIALDAASKGKRLGGEGIAYVVDRLGKEAGLRVRPHGLRHAAITEALEATNGDLRRVRAFSRHKSMDMLLIYDDARKDFGGEVADLLDQR